ncbi:hypothetical protein [Nitrobacter winogradskyi]|uniref:Uncharacterized protein n=2 Tax=Nitrobacter winogradskyi TaxID=913 RepID=A0ACC6AJB5_NITWI|nr:hypothetical protein [Nitrobacter winogradskyi]MCP1999774.1 hypothetical protein [Nitrobacter winogradskyi]GEC15875.1 hypothetical protein NWI01_17670 [Nitrobacter winogradskyi]
MVPLKFRLRRPAEVAVGQVAPAAEVLEQAVLVVAVPAGILARVEDRPVQAA